MAYLLRQGYEVFRSVSPNCTCDLIACRDGETLRVEVRVGRLSRRPTDRADVYAVIIGTRVKLTFVRHN